jgi:hypothetical protein
MVFKFLNGRWEMGGAGDALHAPTIFLTCHQMFEGCFFFQ